MTLFLRNLRETFETAGTVILSAGFMIAWLFCWPFYRLVRSYLLRGV